MNVVRRSRNGVWLMEKGPPKSRCDLCDCDVNGTGHQNEEKGRRLRPSRAAAILFYVHHLSESRQSQRLIVIYVYLHFIPLAVLAGNWF